MDQSKTAVLSSESAHTWDILENLIAPDPNLREQALAELASMEDFQKQPLVVYLLASRLLDPDLEIRFHAVQLIGDRLALDPIEGGLPENSFKTFVAFTTQLDKGQLVKLLEVSVGYLAAEEAIANILKLCSYAGKALSGIVNDRKLPIAIRQQAIHFCGEVGFLTTTTAIRNLIQRIEKGRNRSGLATSRKKHLDEEKLYSFAVSALGKLE